MMYAIGVMQVPADFRYMDVFLKGRPQHGRDDPFRIRHPKMPCERRAKIFSPFDALKGFGEALAAQEVLSGKESVSADTMEVLSECAADTGLKNPRSYGKS